MYFQGRVPEESTNSTQKTQFPRKHLKDLKRTVEIYHLLVNLRDRKIDVTESYRISACY